MINFVIYPLVSQALIFGYAEIASIGKCKYGILYGWKIEVLF